MHYLDRSSPFLTTGQYVRKLRAQNALMQKAIAVERPGSQSGTLDFSSVKVRAQNKGYMYIAPALHVDDDGFGRAKTFRCKTIDRMPRCSWTHTCYTPNCHVLEIGRVPLLLNAERRGQRPSGIITVHARAPPRSLGNPTVACRIQMTRLF